ncbi:hypothetical protein DFQ30_001785, partial [Apophysomyces sp. BC1015]
MAAEKEPDTARLTIEGRITPGPCMLTLSPAHLEMAPIRTEDLATDHPYYEGEKGEVKLNIFCPTNTSVGITSQDEKPDPNPFQQMSDDKSMPLATLKGIFSSDDAVVGVYALQLINMKYTRNGTEHKSEAIGRVHKGSGEWTSTPGGPLNGSEYNEISWGSNGGTIQAIGLRPDKGNRLSRRIDDNADLLISRAGTRANRIDFEVPMLLPGIASATGVMPETSVVLLSEKTGEAVIKVRNTDPYPVILYTSVSDTAEDREPLVVATPLATRLEAGEEQLVRFMLINDEPLRTERMKRVMFEGIPPVMPGKEGVNLTVRQDLPVIVTPRELPVDEQPWKHLSWRVQGRVLTLENPSPYVVRLEQSATIVPKGTVLKLPQRYILPGARVDVSLDKGIVPKHITALRLSTVSRYGYATGAFALIVRLSAPRVGRSGCAPRRYKKVAAVVAATWLAALCALAFPTCSFATTVQFDSHRLQARGLPSALADYYANGSRFGPGYNRVALYVNGSSRGDVDAYFDTHGELCITGDLLERAGLVLPDAKTARTYPPALAAVGSDSTVDAGVVSACYDYRAAFPQTQIKLLPSAARVELIVPPQAVRPRREAPQQFSSGGVAGILNYDVRMAQWRYRQRSRSDVRVRVETGFNAQDWVVRSRQSMTKTARRSEFSHDAAYAQRTFHDAGTILQAGQLYLTNAVTGGAALHGVQLLPDEALSAARPHATHIEGIASSQARVDVTQAGRHLYTTVVPPGPFSIEQFEVPSDALDLIVTVTESDGSQREFVVPATSLAMDAPVGVPGFSLAVGNFSGLDGFYPAVAASAGWRFGSSTSASATTILSTRYQGAAASLLVVPRSGPVIATRLHVSRQSAGSASGARVGIRASGQLGRALSVRLSGGIKTA